MSVDRFITITAFARLCGASAKTLRLYDRVGLFRPAFVRGHTRYRFYAEEQLAQFARIKALRDCGASLADIAAAMATRRTSREQASLLRSLRAAQLGAIDEARRSLAWLDAQLDCAGDAAPFAATITRSAALRVASFRITLRNYAEIDAHESALRLAVTPVDGRVRGVLWHRCADRGVIESEPFAETGPTEGALPGFERTTLPAAIVARAFSSFEDDEAEDTHVGLSRWIHARGFEPAGARREIYRGRLLEIQQPIRGG